MALIAFIIYITILLIFLLLSSFVIYHLIKYNFGDTFMKIMTAIFVAVIIIIFIITFVFLTQAEKQIYY